MNRVNDAYMKRKSDNESGKKNLQDDPSSGFFMARCQQAKSSFKRQLAHRLTAVCAGMLAWRCSGTLSP